RAGTRPVADELTTSSTVAAAMRRPQVRDVVAAAVGAGDDVVGDEGVVWSWAFAAGLADESVLDDATCVAGVGAGPRLAVVEGEPAADNAQLHAIRSERGSGTGRRCSPRSRLCGSRTMHGRARRDGPPGRVRRRR